MSKTIEMSLLVPGERGWEVWKQSAEGGYTRLGESDSADATLVSGLPSGSLAMLFPVKSVHAMPFRASSPDPALFPDLATMHAELQGVRPDPMAGQLSDTFEVERGVDSALLLAVVVKSPGEGDLPVRTPKEFDLSARAFAPATGEIIALWKEFGRWVFAIYRGGKLLYSAATGIDSADPDAALVTEVKLALTQLSFQGIGVKPDEVRVWSSSSTAGAMSNAFDVGVKVEPRPDPRLPDPHSKILPADVRAARREAKAKQQKLALAGAVALIYLGLGGWYGYGLWKDQREVKKILTEANAVAPEAETLAYQEHLASWDELSPVLDKSKFPVELMFRVANAIPPTGRLRLKTAEINEGEIKLVGEADQQGPVGQFSLNLTRESFGLAHYKWDCPPANNSAKGWEFTFTGTIPTQQTP